MSENGVSIVSWNLKCYGIRGLAESREDRMSFLAYMVPEATRCPAYSGAYLNYYMKSVQFCMPARKEDGVDYDYSIQHADTHNTDSKVWTCKIRKAVKTNRDDPMSKCVFVSNLNDKGHAVVELINSDVLPCYDEGEVIQFQVVAKAMSAKYYVDDDQYVDAEGMDIKSKNPESEPERIVQEPNSVFPIGYLNWEEAEEKGEPAEEYLGGVMVARVVGKAKAFAIKDVVFEGKLMNQYVSCMIDTPFGELPIVHTFEEVPKEYHENLKVGSIVSALCFMSGDVLIYDHKDGLVLDEENNLKLFKSAFNGRGQWGRLYPVLTENCHYASEGSGIDLTGRDEIIRFLSEREQMMDSPELTYHACYGNITYPTCIDSDLGHKKGEKVILLRQGEKHEYDAVVFLHTREDGKVDDIYICKDNRYCFDVLGPSLLPVGYSVEEVK